MNYIPSGVESTSESWGTSAELPAARCRRKGIDSTIRHMAMLDLHFCSWWLPLKSNWVNFTTRPTPTLTVAQERISPLTWCLAFYVAIFIIDPGVSRQYVSGSWYACLKLVQVSISIHVMSGSSWLVKCVLIKLLAKLLKVLATVDLQHCVNLGVGCICNK